jgi:hypothetical protein
MQLHTPATHPQDAIVGRTFKSWEGMHYTCDSYEGNLGYWMFRTDVACVRRNISEQAIGSSFHRIDDEY